MDINSLLSPSSHGAQQTTQQQKQQSSSTTPTPTPPPPPSSSSATTSNPFSSNIVSTSNVKSPQVPAPFGGSSVGSSPLDGIPGTGGPASHSPAGISHPLHQQTNNNNNNHNNNNPFTSRLQHHHLHHSNPQHSPTSEIDPVHHQQHQQQQHPPPTSTSYFPSPPIDQSSLNSSSSSSSSHPQRPVVFHRKSSSSSTPTSRVIMDNNSRMETQGLAETPPASARTQTTSPIPPLSKAPNDSNMTTSAEKDNNFPSQQQQQQLRSSSSPHTLSTPLSRLIPTRSPSKLLQRMDSGKEADKKDNPETDGSRRMPPRTASSTVEVIMRDPPPSPSKAPAELFSDEDEELEDVDAIKVDEEKPEALKEAEVFRIIELREQFDLSNIKEPGNTNAVPPSFAEHLECISLLRRGYLAENRSPNYEFKDTLRDERERLLESYPMTEDLWSEWLDDEMAIASDLSRKVDILELWTKCLAHEPSSVRLWSGYTKYVLRTWRESSRRAKQDDGDDEKWSEVFTFEMVLSVFSQAVKATMYNIPESNEIWDKYRELHTIDLNPDSASTARIDVVQNLYMNRLQIIHSTLDSTFSSFSSFVSTYQKSASYETIMQEANKVYQATKVRLEGRLDFELRLKRALNTPEEGQVWAEYVKRETTSSPKKKLDVNLCLALFERCTLRYPMESKVWEEYVFFALDKAEKDPRILSILERATLHCQWSGLLWAQRILALEKRFKPLDFIEKVKHKATESRLLLQKEELFKVHMAWCNVLKRIGVGKDPNNEDMADFAEFGIRSALTEISHIDTKFRMSRLLISFLTQRGNKSGAKEEWKKIGTQRNKEYEYWLQYYQWALVNLTPQDALGVMKEALRYKDDMDWPEKIIETYMQHVEDYGGPADMEEAQVKMWRVQKAVGERRETEAQAYRQAEAQTVENAAAAVTAATMKDVKGKRRRSSVFEGAPPQKKTKAEDDDDEFNEEREDHEDIEMADGSKEVSNADAEEMEKMKKRKAKENKAGRDREKNTIIARNLPQDIDELGVRKFFRDCGKINTLHLLVEPGNDSTTATIEFATEADVLSAQTRDKKRLNDREIQVNIGFATTVYVTNFPPTADSEWIKDIFKDCGEIVDTRFPSLQYNTHRRFCYVQFASSDAAEKACNLNGKEVGENLSLIVKISDPGNREERSGAVYEGREVFVSNLEFGATDDDLRKFFSKKWKVESVRIPRNPAGKHKGFGFVSFETKDDADASISMNDERLKGRKLMVVIAVPKAPMGNKHNLSASHQSNSDATKNGTASSSAGSPPSSEEISQKTLYITNIRDTINDAKIRALFGKYGEIRRVALRPDHQGAIVEFVNVASAGKASLALEGHDLEGGKLQFVSYKEMVDVPPEKKEKPGKNPFAKKKTEAAPLVPRAIISTSGPKRRGIGFAKASNAEAKPENSKDDGEPEAMDTEKREQGEEGNASGPKTRSNEQFRAMFLKK